MVTFMKILASRNILKSKLFTLAKFYVGSSAAEVDSLKLKVGSGTILESVPEHLGHDISIFPLYNIIAGPLKVLPMKNNKWNVTNYEKVKEVFKEWKKIDRQDIFNRI